VIKTESGGEPVVFVSRISRSGSKLYITVPKYVAPLLARHHRKEVKVTVEVVE